MSSSFVGKVIDNYRILESVGVGGMGVVFKAINTKLDKLVALKMIAPGLSMNVNFINRFQKEAKALAKLADPNIVAIYDLRQENDQWYIVMEYVDGPNLIDKIKKEGAFDQEESISIVKQVLSAIGHAHDANIIHRDMKPNNVMISSDGTAKITDFGLAKDTSVSTHTMSIESGGTLYYMSPEHVKGFSHTDKRSDIYSIGMTFYEMLSGKVPFENIDSDFDIRETIVRKEFIKPTTYNKKIPEQLEKIVMKSIAKEPGERYQTAYEMLDDIEEYETKVLGNTVKKRIRPNRGKYQKAEKKPQRIILLISVFGLIALLTFFFLYYNPTVLQQLKGEEILESKNDVVNNDVIEEEKTPDKIYTEKENISEPAKVETPVIKKPLKKEEKIIPTPKTEEKAVIQQNPKPVVKIPETGMAVIDIKPDGTTVKIDGEEIDVNSNPLNVSDLRVGEHNVEISKAGFSDFSKKIEIKANEKVEVFAILTELTGTLVVRVKPWGSIYIDDKIQKENTDRKFETTLAAKTYRLKVVHPTFGEREKEITILPGKENKVMIDFTKAVAK